MVRINLPLEMDGGKLKPKDSDARIQLSEFNLIGAGIGAELEVGSESVVGAKVSVKVGGEKGSTSMRDVFAATKTATTDTSVGGLLSFNAKKSEASDKNGEAVGSKESAKTLFTDFKKLTVEAKTLESKIKSIESKIAAISTYTGPSFLKPTVSINDVASLPVLKEQMKDKLESAQAKLSESKTKIGEAKTSVGDAKTKIGEAFTGIKALHDKASQHKDLRSALIDTQSKGAGIDQNIKEIDKLEKEIDFAML